MKKKMLTTKKVNVPQKKAKNPLEEKQVLYVAEFAAAISDRLLSLTSVKPQNYRSLYRVYNGLTGIWHLCARAAVAMQLELNAAGDPHCESTNYMKLCANLGDALFDRSRTYLKDEVIAKIVRQIAIDALFAEEDHREEETLAEKVRKNTAAGLAREENLL